MILEDYEASLFSSRALAELKGKKLLITGAAGMLSSYIVDVLLIYNDRLKNSADRIRITGVVRNRESVARRFAGRLDREDLHFIIQDVVDPFTTAETFDCIIHAASSVNPKFLKEDPVGTLMTNIEGTRNLLNYARHSGVESFLFVSSANVYGNPLGREPLNEDSFGTLNPLEPGSCYAEAKRAAEALCMAWCSQYGVPVKIVRPFQMYGPGMKLDEGKVTADFIRDILNKRDIIIRSDGLAGKTFCYLSDVTEAFLQVLVFGEKGVPYNVGNPEAEMSIGELAAVLVRLYPELGLKVKYDNQQKNHTPKGVAFLPDIQRIKQLGWQPVVTIEKGFQRTIRSFSE